MARPKITSLLKRDQAIMLRFNLPEISDIHEAAQASGKDTSSWCRDKLLELVSSNSKPEFRATLNPVSSNSKPRSANVDIVSSNSKLHQKLPTVKPLEGRSPQAETSNTPTVKMTHVERERTRTSARAGALTKKERETDQELAPSLRSVAAAAPSVTSPEAEAQLPEPEQPEPEIKMPPLRLAARPLPQLDPEHPWLEPTPVKQSIKLSTGESVDNMWLFSNGCRIPASDADRIMNTPALKNLRNAMLVCFARSIRDTYRTCYCTFYGKRLNAWRDTTRSTNAFRRAAEFMVPEYISRNMTSLEFIEACNEMRPKSVKFVTSDMLGNTIGSRVAAWVPPELRERDKAWDTHEDQSGSLWITPPGETPVLVIRTAAERDKFLKQIKVR